MFKTVAKLPAGASFGERALLKNEERAATIVCSKDCAFATLHRRDFTNIIGSVQKRELKEKVDFLKRFRMFSQLRATVIEKISYYMKTVDFVHNQKVYTENVSATDGIYFICSGEFEISQISQLDLGTERKQPDPNRVPYKSQQKIQSMILSRSQVQLKTKTTFAKPSLQMRPQKLRLYLLGNNEIFGLEEIVENS